MTGSRIHAVVFIEINDLGWPWTAVKHSVAPALYLCLTEPITQIWVKIDKYY